MTSAREILAKRGRQPVVIQRTEKRPGDLVLHSWAQPVERLSTACGNHLIRTHHHDGVTQ